MAASLRKSGIDIVGDVVWGTHFCLFYRDKNDLLEMLVPYFKAGLENNEYCMWVTSALLKEDDARQAMAEAMPDFAEYVKKRQIEIIPYSQWYTKGGAFDSQRVLNGWVARLTSALSRGFDGLRLTGNTFWLEKSDWQAFMDYEGEVNSVIGKYRMLAICTYAIEKCGASEVVDVVRTHQFTLVRQAHQWELIESSDYKKTKQALRESEEKFRMVFAESPIGSELYDVEGRLIAVNQACLDIFGTTEERYRLLAENVADVIWTAEMDGKLTYVSPSVRLLTGYTSDEIISKPLEQLVAPESLAAVREVFEQDLPDGDARPTSQTLETELRRKNGSCVWVETRWQVMPGLKGMPAYVLGVSRDISERKRGEEELRRLSHRLVEMQEEERRGVAAELHDQVGQSLTGLKLLIARAMKSSRETIHPVLEEANSVVSDLMTRVRNLSLDLRPAMLDDLGLLPALLWHFERYTTQTQVKINFEHTSLDNHFPPAVSTAIYRIVQEALNNVSKHANVDQVTVRAWSTDDSVCAQIEDRGKGFDPDEIAATSSGLVGMQERAHLLGGKLTIETTPGAGTRVTAELPLSGAPK